MWFQRYACGHTHKQTDTLIDGLFLTTAAHEVRRAGFLTCESCHLERSARPHPHRRWSCQVPETAQITLFSQAFNICWFLRVLFCVLSFGWLLKCTYGLGSRSNGRTVNIWHDMMWCRDRNKPALRCRVLIIIIIRYEQTEGQRSIANNWRIKSSVRMLRYYIT